jgi:bacteriorhodopsin
MKELTWAGVVVFTVVVAAIVVMYVNTADPATRDRLIGLLQLLVTFVAGSAAAGVAGWHRGFAKGLLAR